MTRSKTLLELWPREWCTVAMKWYAIVTFTVLAGCESKWINVSSEPAPSVLEVTRTIEVPDLHDILTRGRQVWIVGVEGTLLYSSDEGEHWVLRETGTTMNLTDITGSADGKSIWILGEGGGMIHSDDQGLTWKQVEFPTSQVHADAVFATPDGIHVFAAGAGMAFSHDSGRSWAHSKPVDMVRSLSGVVSDAHGQNVWAAGGVLLRSSNSGVTWRATSVPGDLTTGLCSDDCTRIWFAGFDGRLIHSQDSGRIWTQAAVPTKDWISSLVAVPGTRKVRGVTQRSLILSDDGRTWTHRELRAGTSANAIATVGMQSRLIIVGDGGYIARSDDAGTTWVELQANAKIEVPEGIAASPSQKRLCLAGGPLISGTVWIACSSGDGGKWTAPESLRLRRTSRLKAIYGLSDTEWIAADSDGLILKSNDGGHNWQIREQKAKEELN
jgi:photosystem II stability/assembly factor-like uncharacterized protein